MPVSVPEVFPSGSVVKNLPANAGDAGSIPGWGTSLGKGIGNPLQYSCLENPLDRGAWQGSHVHGIAKSHPMSMGLQRVRHDLETKQQQESLEKMLISNEKAQSQMPRTEERGWAVHMEVNQSSVWGCQVTRGEKRQKVIRGVRKKKNETWERSQRGKILNKQKEEGKTVSIFQVHVPLPSYLSYYHTIRVTREAIPTF